MLRSPLKFLILALALLVSVGVQADTQETVTTTVTPTADDATTAGQKSTTVTTTTAPNGATVEKRVTVTTMPPAAKEVIETPKGELSCFNVEAGWNQSVWVPQHRVCQYGSTTSAAAGQAWVESYWACTQYTQATCTKWEWKPGHWVKTFEVY